MLVGGPDFAYRGYEAELHRHATALGLDGVVRWLGDRADVPRLLAGLDALVRLSEDEGIPHVLAQAGAACLPVVATRDNGAAEQIADGRSGLFVPHRAPAAAAAARSRLVRDPGRTARPGAGADRRPPARHPRAGRPRRGGPGAGPRPPGRRGDRR